MLNQPAPVQNATPIPLRSKLREEWKKKYKTEKLAPKIKENLLQLLRGQYEMERAHRLEQAEDEFFYHGMLQMWDEVARRMPSFRDLKVNPIRQVVDYAAGMAKKRATNGAVGLQGVAYGSAEAREIRQEYDRRLMMAQNMTEWPFHRDKCIDSALRCGVGYIHTGVKVSLENGRLRFFCSSPHWKNVYADTGGELETGRFCFILQRRDPFLLKSRFPKKKQLIEKFVGEWRQSTSALDDEDDYGINARSLQTLESTETHFQRMEIITGTAYFRHTVFYDNMPFEIILHVRILTDRSLSQLEFLTEPSYLGHSRIPVSRLARMNDPKTHLPYSDIIRDMRGITRVEVATLRNWLALITGRGAVVNVDAIPEESQDEYLRAIASRLQQAIFVLPEFGEKGSVKVEHNIQDAQKMSAAWKDLHDLARSTTSFHPALLGDKSNVDGASAMQTLANDAEVAGSSFYRSCDRVSKAVSEDMLSSIERYNGELDWDVLQANGQIIEISSDGDATIEGNRAIFTIVPSNRDTFLGKAFSDLIQSFVNKAGGPEGLAYLQIWLKGLALPESDALMGDIKDLCRQIGAPVLSSVMTEEEKQQLTQQKQQETQIQMQQIQLEMGKMAAEIENLKSRAFATVKKAEDPPPSEKELKLRQTIARLSEQALGGTPPF